MSTTNTPKEDAILADLDTLIAKKRETIERHGNAIAHHTTTGSYDRAAEIARDMHEYISEVETLRNASIYIQNERSRLRSLRATT